MKRLCRSVQIHKWPNCKRKKVKTTHSNLRNVNESVQGIEEGILESSRRDPSCDNKRMQDAGLVTIKATYADDIIRFQIFSSSTMAELSENLYEGLPLTDGSFRIQYQDDEVLPHESGVIDYNQNEGSANFRSTGLNAYCSTHAFVY
ncbi:hypothetical protein RJ640_019062 [Escallonia rubra]|uniref:PB1 domain-containing protein n=1 Tax=Escallonia rubra TaxID=112253 RepID=A0AA88QHF0_9ASTE|nr:hypothetical protein RJ640_019062 [Escallonia rubra]